MAMRINPNPAGSGAQSSLDSEMRKAVFAQPRPKTVLCRVAGSNGMDPSSPNRHQGARLEVSTTSRPGAGVRHEAYSRWGRFGKERLSGTRRRRPWEGGMAAKAHARELAQGVARDGRTWLRD